MVTGFAADEEDQNADTLKKYAALRIIDIMRKGSLHETLVKIGAYILSEFGYLIAEEPGKGYQE
jgi:AP-2 complex subunit alpha